VKWISLRTTNVIEPLNKEFKGKTKRMEIVAGEPACYRRLAFIPLNIELSRRTTKARKYGPIYLWLSGKMLTRVLAGFSLVLS
jgi:hypothetical protein